MLVFKKLLTFFKVRCSISVIHNTYQPTQGTKASSIFRTVRLNAKSDLHVDKPLLCDEQFVCQTFLKNYQNFPNFSCPPNMALSPTIMISQIYVVAFLNIFYKEKGEGKTMYIVSATEMALFGKLS
jgi:hypothetical protein